MTGSRPGLAAIEDQGAVRSARMSLAGPITATSGLDRQFRPVGELPDGGIVGTSLQRPDAGGRPAVDRERTAAFTAAWRAAAAGGETHGAANGAPWLGPRRGYEEWSRVLGAEFAALRARVEAAEAAGRPEPEGLIPAYGATDPAEFFAVLSELFFERADALRAAHAALYEQLRQAYRTDPAHWE